MKCGEPNQITEPNWDFLYSFRMCRGRRQSSGLEAASSCIRQVRRVQPARSDPRPYFLAVAASKSLSRAPSVRRTEWRGEKGSRVIATPVEPFSACFAQLARWHTTVLELSTYQTTELNGLSRPGKDDNGIRRAVVSQKSMAVQTRILPAKPLATQNTQRPVLSHTSPT